MTAPVPSIASVRRRRAYIAIGCCLAAVVAIVVLAFVLSENVVYFRTVSEAVRDRSSQGDARFRLAGQVVKGTVKDTRDGVHFELTDGKATAEVVHRGDIPQLFKENVPVVCEGHWGKGKAFDSDRILIRHGNDYTPPKVDTSKATKGAA